MNAHNCVIDAWCIPQFPRQPALLAALLSLLLFALAFSRRTALLPWVPQAPALTRLERPWRGWLAVGLFGALALAVITQEAQELIVAQARSVSPAIWLLALFACLATALLWDVEDTAELQRTLANLTVAFGLGCTILSVASFLAGHGILWSGLAPSALLLLGASYWSWRVQTFLKPADHAMMLLLALLALLLGLRNIWSWHYAFIGDEWGFFEIARTLLHRPELYATFTTHDSNGYHTVFSSYLQAWTMLATTENIFGWRLSSLLPLVFSVPAIYAFAFWWAGRPVAWLSAGTLAASHMLLSFAMVPYNNTQALLPLTWGLGLFAFAIRSNSRLRFLLVGLTVGLGFLVYGLGRLAALPIGLLLLLHIWPERSQYPADEPLWRPALSRLVGAGVAVLIGAVAMAAPMLFNLQNWQDMLMATPVESEVVGRIDPTVQMWRNVLLGAHSFLTNQKNTHYIVGPYLDPLTALLVLAGSGALLGNLWRRMRWASVFVGGWLLILITSAIQQYDHVSNTRMFLLVVCYALFAGLGGALLLQTVVRRAAIVLVAIVPVIALLVWLNQWHILHISQPNSNQLPIALILRQLQESAAADGGGMRLLVLADDNVQRMSLILRAHDVARERMLFLQADEVLNSPQICGAVDEPIMALVQSGYPQLALLEQFFSSCWPEHELTLLKNQVNEVQFYRFVTAAGMRELAKAPALRASQRLHPDTLFVSGPDALAASAEGELFVLSTANKKIWRMAADGKILGSFSLTQQLPTALALTPNGEIIVAAQESTQKLVWYQQDGEVIRTYGEEQIRINPTGLAVDADGTLFVSDGGNGRILRLLAQSETVNTLTANGRLLNPSAVAVAADQSLWVVDIATRNCCTLHRPMISWIQFRLAKFANWNVPIS
ncbi:MAG: hypothetical protein R2867_23320 [Caldilineaceae bacterium]